MAMGMQDRFSWGQVGLSAFSAAATAGLAGASNTSSLSAFAGKGLGETVTRTMAVNAMTQGVGLATGLQKSFNWTSVAASGAAAGASGWMGDSLGWNSSDPVAGVGYGTLRGLVSGGIQSQLTGQRPNWSAIAAESFGSALGDQVVGSIQSRDQQRQQQQQRLADAMAEQLAEAKQPRYDTRGVMVADGGKWSRGQEILSDAGPGYSVDGTALRQVSQPLQPLAVDDYDPSRVEVPAQMREMTEAEGFFAFNPVGQTIRAVGRAGMGLLREGDAFFGDVLNRSQSGMASLLGIEGNASLDAQSQFFQSADQKGWGTTLGYTAWGMMSGPMRTTADFASGLYLHSPDRIGQSGFELLSMGAGGLAARGLRLTGAGEGWPLNFQMGPAHNVANYSRLKSYYRSLDLDYISPGELNLNAPPPLDLSRAYVPRSRNGEVLPLLMDDRKVVVYPMVEAEGRAHTALGSTVSGRTGVTYRQSATFINGSGIPWGRVDWYDHGLPLDHPRVHIHPLKPLMNKSGVVVDWQQGNIAPFFGH